jgi:hypothetical protein
VEGGFVADGELVESRSDGAVAFEPVDAALDGVTPPVVDRAELRRPAAPGAPVLAVTDLVGLGRDRAPDAASARPPYDLAALDKDTVWPGSGSADQFISAGYLDGTRASVPRPSGGGSRPGQRTPELQGVVRLP